MRALTAEQWKALLPLLEQVRPKSGPKIEDFRQTFAGVVFRLRTGAPWRDLPPRFGPWWRAWTLHRRWARIGVRDAPHRAALQARRPDLAEVFLDSAVVRARQKAAGGGNGQGPDRSRVGFGAKACAVADDTGRLLSMTLLPGQASDLGGARAAALAPPSPAGRLVADRRFSAGWFRDGLAGIGSRPVIPAHPTHPPVADDRRADARRSAVGRGRDRLKERRGVAARFDKTAACFAAGLPIASVFDRIKD